MLNFAFCSLKIQTRIMNQRYYMKYILINISCGENFLPYVLCSACIRIFSYSFASSKYDNISLFCYICVFIVGPPFVR